MPLQSPGCGESCLTRCLRIPSGREDHRPILYIGTQDHPYAYGHLRGKQAPEWNANDLFFAKDGPPVGCIVEETTVPVGDQILRSEVVTALHLMNHHIHHGLYPGHTIPVS
jgi:hypothetical protein